MMIGMMIAAEAATNWRLPTVQLQVLRPVYTSAWAWWEEKFESGPFGNPSSQRHHHDSDSPTREAGPSRG